MGEGDKLCAISQTRFFTARVTNIVRDKDRNFHLARALPSVEELNNYSFFLLCIVKTRSVFLTDWRSRVLQEYERKVRP